jgi:hypothetical protein
MTQADTRSSRLEFFPRQDAGTAIAATGQEKVKKGFAPLVEGFNNYIPFNDLAAA